MAHVGDSRLYALREGETWQLSDDHTLSAELFRQGVAVYQRLGRQLASQLRNERPA